MRNDSIIILLIILFLTAGCSKSLSMTEPGFESNPGKFELSMDNLLPVLVSDWGEPGDPLAGMGTIGLYHVSLNSNTLNGEISSLRQSSLADVLETVDITNFLALAPCTSCARIDNISIDSDNNVVASIGIKHPFDPGDPLKPITGRNRADLHVFNVEGIVVSQSAGSIEFNHLGQTVADKNLLNPDGYTACLDQYLDGIFPTDATIHPYIMHFDDYSQGNFDPSNPMGFESVTTPPPSGNLVMPMGCDYDYKDYIFDLDTDGIEFILAIECTYAVSAEVKVMRFSPEYRIPQHNKKAASEVRVEVTQNNMIPLDTSSTAELTVSVLDINHGVEVGNEINQMLADSSVSNISVEIPGVTAEAQSNYVFVSGDGRDPLNPLTFTVTVTNTAGGNTGNYTGLVKVLDSYTPGLNTSPILNGMDGITRVDPLLNPISGLFNIPEFATYAVFDIPLETSNLSPVAVLAPNPAFACENGTITFDATASYDDDGAIIAYEWDWNLPSGNPLDFSMDTSTVNGDVESDTYLVAEETFAAVRVVDDGTPQLWDIMVVPVTVSSYAVDLQDIVSVPSSGIQNINFSHTQDTLEHETHLPCRGMEGLACADGYVYATFYGDNTSEGGIYFTRSSDSGNSWDDPIKLVSMPFTQVYGGCAIDAAGSEVHIAYCPSGNHPNGPSNNGHVYLLSNYNHGEGSFDEVLVHDRPDQQGVSYIDLAIDPLDTENIYVVCGDMTGPTFMPWWYYDQIRVAVSNSGASGPWFEHTMWGASSELDDNYGMDVAVSPVDGDVYILSGEAYYVAIYKSEDNGATFPTDALHYERFYGTGFYWARDFDLALHPTNSEIYYVALACRKAINPFPIRVYQSTDGINLSQLSFDIVDNIAARKIMPAITVSGAGDIYITWADNRTGNFEIFMDHMPPSGSFGTDYQLSDGNFSNERDPEIIMAPNGCDFIVMWEEDGNDPAGTLKSRRG